MKGFTKTIALLTALVMCLSVTAFAANVENDLASITAENNAIVEFVSTDAEETQITFTYENASIVEGGYYLVMVLADNGSENIVPTESNILYINQMEGSAGSVSFTVYASREEGNVEDSVIVLYGLDSSVRLATIKSAVMIGDSNGDGKINSADLIRLAKYIANKNSVQISSEKAADANGDGKVNSADLIRLAKYIANKNSVTLG